MLSPAVIRERAARTWSAITAKPWQRIALVVAAVFGFAAIAAWTFSGQTPKQFPDSGLLLQLAHAPPQLTGPKPLFVPLVYRLVGADADAIASLQQTLAIAAWATLGIVVALAVRRRRSRVAAALIALAFVLAPLRAGWTTDLLTESINDSLLALVTACAIALASFSPRRALAAALVTSTAAWLFTRDTNAITALAACAAGICVWPPRLRRDRWGLATVVAIASVAGVVIWSASAPPDRPALVTQSGAKWPAELSARDAFPVVDNLLGRVLPDADARAFFVDHGLPQADALMRFSGHWAGEAAPVFLSPRLADARAWIGEHAAGTYARWLVRHPVARAGELAAALFEVLAPSDLASYMPPGWDAGGVIRRLTANEVVVLALLLISPVMLRRPRAHPVSGVALCLIASGLVGAAAAYYGDTIEIGRHCYGAGQQIVLGLCLAVVARLDHRAIDRRTAAISPASAGSRAAASS